MSAAVTSIGRDQDAASNQGPDTECRWIDALTGIVGDFGARIWQQQADDESAWRFSRARLQ